MADYVPIILNDDETATYLAGGTISGGDVVVLSAAGSAASPNGTVTTAAGASNAVVGVAGKDAVVGDRVPVLRGGIHELVSGAAITAPTPVKSASSGRVQPYVDGTDPAGQLLGTALTTVAGAALLVRIQWTK